MPKTDRTAHEPPPPSDSLAHGSVGLWVAPAAAARDTARDGVGGTGPGSLVVEGPDGARVRTVNAVGAFPY